MDDMTQLLHLAARRGHLSHLDCYFSAEIHDQHHQLGQNNQTNLHLLIAAALTSHAVHSGHSCLNLETVADTRLFDDPALRGLHLPKIHQLIASLKASPAVGRPHDHRPLILDEQHRLYLGRYWWFEQGVAESLLARAVAANNLEIEPDALEKNLSLLFPDKADQQRSAAKTALNKQLTVISGGPGTGKTHTVATILALLLQLSNNGPPRIRMAAPTGKAAARLTETIRQIKPQLQFDQDLISQIPEEAVTIHRLLGVRPRSVTPRHHADNQLHLDVLIIDEASMIDLPLMARLLAAIPDQAKLILLGDKDQLSSVEAGSVFADICDQGQSSANPLSESIVTLEKSFRFKADQGIARLTRHIRTGDSHAVQELLAQEHADIRLHRLATEQDLSLVISTAIKEYQGIFQAETADEAIKILDQFRILCAVRKGRTGTEQINQTLEKVFIKQQSVHQTNGWYKGQAILIKTNDYSQALFNGDLGLIWPDRDGPETFYAWFRNSDQSLRRIPVSRLPAFEPAYAMTVHKAQGSEFNKVMFLLPDQDQTRIMTRELAYTAISRAKNTVEIIGQEQILLSAIQQRTLRDSGLADKIHHG